MSSGGGMSYRTYAARVLEGFSWTWSRVAAGRPSAMHGFCMGGLYVYAASGLRPSNVPALRVCERVVATVIVSDEHNTPRGTEEHAKSVEKLAGRCLRSAVGVCVCECVPPRPVV